ARGGRAALRGPCPAWQREPRHRPRAEATARSPRLLPQSGLGPQAEGEAYVLLADDVAVAGQVGQGTGDATHAVQTAGAEPVGAQLVFEQARSGRRERHRVVEKTGRELGVAAHASFVGSAASLDHSRSDGRRGLAPPTVQQVVDVGLADDNTQIEAVEQGPREPPGIARPGGHSAAAPAVAAASARAGVGGADEEEAGREADRGPCSAHTYNTFFQRLA